jgi:hypothetical protein
MKPNETYVCRHNIVTNTLVLEAGGVYKADTFSSVIDSETAEVVHLPLHIARNPSWYFAQAGFGQNAAPPVVTQAEYAAAIVRGNEGMTANELYDVMMRENFAPYGGKVIPYNGFTTLLSQDHGIEMHKDGTLVKGIKHGTKNCTYHVKRTTKRTDGWAS